LKTSRKEAKKNRDDLASEQLRRSNRAQKETPKEKATPGGLAGVSLLIIEKLAQIGLKHVSVSQGGNCAYLATSQAIFGNTNKWQTVRREASLQLETNRGDYLHEVTNEILEDTLREIKTSGEYIDQLGIKVIEDTYQRHIEVWMRNDEGDDIMNHPHYQAKENSILMWYNGLNIPGARGNHYDSLIVTDATRFKNRTRPPGIMDAASPGDGMQLQKASHEQSLAPVHGRTETEMSADHTKMASSEGKMLRDDLAAYDQSMAASPSLLREPHPTAAPNRPGVVEESE
jgi:hypothetical protein